MTTTLSRWSPLPLRILLGIGCVHHGWHNVIMADERQAFTWMLREIGALPAPGVATPESLRELPAPERDGHVVARRRG